MATVSSYSSIGRKPTYACPPYIISHGGAQGKQSDLDSFSAASRSLRHRFTLAQERGSNGLSLHTNLGSAASQRGESHHPVIRKITSCQLSFKDSGKRLATTVSSPLRILLHSNTIYRGPTIVAYRSTLRHSST